MVLENFVPKDSDPFSKHQIEYLFEQHPHDSLRLQHKESNNIEYKKTFHFESFDNHARTFAAYANTRGGYFIFGVDDDSRKLLGLQDDRFDRLDSTVPTQFLNKKFVPEIQWESHLHVYEGKQFGLLYIHPSSYKPVIARENGDRIIEGQIFYRYNGLSETIKYAELRQIMDDIKRTEQELWVRHIQRLASVGVDNAAVFDFEDGSAHGKRGAFIIDADLLSQIQFLREGEFIEKIGSPAIRLVGEAEVLAAGVPSKSIDRLSAIILTEYAIYEVFLKRETPFAPVEYIQGACSLYFTYLPIYYFAYLAGFTFEKLKDYLRDDVPTGRILLERVEDDVSHHRYYQMPKTDRAMKPRMGYVNAIYNQTFDLDSDYELGMLVQSLQLLTKDKVDTDYLFSTMYALFEKHWQDKDIMRTDFRKAISHLDYLIYFPMISKN